MPCSSLPPGFDAQWLISNFLYGVNLTDDNGEPYPESIYTDSILAAFEQAESDLGVSLSLKCVRGEVVNTTIFSPERYYMMFLKEVPIQRIDSLSFQLGSWGETEIPLDWIEVESAESGLIRIVPGRTQIRSAFWMGFFNNSSLPGYGRNYTPQSPNIHVSYVAGYDGVEFPFPPMLKQLIGLSASQLALDTAGDLIAGAGVASASISMDGLSQSIGTTASATSSGYRARIDSYDKKYERVLKALKAKYAAKDMAFL